MKVHYLSNTPCVDEKGTFINMIHIENILKSIPDNDIFVISALESGKTAFECL